MSARSIEAERLASGESNGIACPSIVRTLLLLSLMFIAGAAEATLPARINSALIEEGITGAVWGLDNGKIMHTEAAGLAERNRLMRANARVHVGSIAKTVLATGVLRLASEGRLDLDAPISELVPDLALNNPWASEAPIRVRHLLDHTAGLDDMRLSQFFSLTATPDMPLTEALDIGRPLLVRSRPGTRFSYSNTGYALLGIVIERVTGQRYETWLDEQLLVPLGMHDSTFAFTTQIGPAADKRLAMGHFEAGLSHPAVAVRVRPAAQFTTTAADMLRFTRFIMGDGRLNGVTFITPELMRQRGRPYGTEAAKAGLPVGYSLGLGLRDRHGAVGLCHGGDTVGFRAMVCAFPKSNRAFFIAFNADVEGANYSRIHSMLVKSLAVTEQPKITGNKHAAGLNAWDGWYVPAPSRFQSFSYLDHLFGVRHVSWHAQSLRVSPLQGGSLDLESAGNQLFRASGRVLPSHALLIGNDGARVLVDDRQTYVRTNLWRIATLWASAIFGMLGVIYALFAGTWRMLRHHPWRTDPFRIAWLNFVALMVVMALFQLQPFLQMGDFTPASILLAVFSTTLPIAAGAGVFQCLRSNRRVVFDLAVLCATLQWYIVLATWGLLPIRTWAL
ncbi:MAG: beta-lactamase family protein [Xanthomonadaceae bacterium]|nr:beta-lactamase family protein [Xanthomonadaceae bacterium]